MRRFFLPLLLQFTALAATAYAQEQGILGNWKEPGGAMITIAPCGGDTCARLVQLPPAVPTRDVHNPDSALRTREICGLVIGQGFHLDRPDRATGGRLYDPKSGKTYHGTMSSQGDSLRLRGYAGLKAFGRTEIWQRTGEHGSCSQR